MARYTVPVCRKCRRAGMKLYLKGVRCETAKCPIEKQWRNKPPGMHFWQRRRPSGCSLIVRPPTAIAALDAAALRRATSVVRNRGHVLDGRHLQAGRLERRNRRLAAATRTLHTHFNLVHT